jgi:serine/threonine protein kinase
VPVVTGQLIAGRYELEEQVGRGGMSTVFRASDHVLDRLVAVKVLHERYARDADYLERFRREARAAAQLGHPNIVTVIDRGEEDGRPYIVFEYVDGVTLKQLVEREGQLSVRDAVAVTLEVARALAFAHARGVVHRDVKPQNVLLDDDGRAKVTDFGIARDLDLDVAVTQTGTVLGTSDYMAPEQARGERTSASGDIYSLGAVLYELLVGEVVFPGESFMAVALRHASEPAPDIIDRRRDVPMRLAALVDRCLEKDPRDRFESMAELVVELEAILEGLGDYDDEDTLVRPAVRLPGSKRRWPVVLMVLALGALGGVVAAVLLARDSIRDALPSSSEPKPVALTAVATYDPEPGDFTEHDHLVPQATDGVAGTSWTTETYGSWFKPGVGLVLRAPRPVALSDVTLRTSTPGFQARIRAGRSESGPFRFVSDRKTVGRSTTFDVTTGGQRFLYYVVWVRLPDGGSAAVNEVTARA